MPPVFTSPQLTHGNLPPHPSQLLPDTAGEQVMPGPQASSPAGTHAPASRADPQLAPQNHLAQLLGVTTAPTVPSSVLHMVPLLCWLSCRHSSSRHPSVSHLSSCTASHSFSCFPSLSSFVKGSLTAPHSSHRSLTCVPTQPLTQFLSSFITILHNIQIQFFTSSTHTSLTLLTPSHTHRLTFPQLPRAHESSQFCTQFPHTPHTFLHSPPPRPLRSSPHCPTLLLAV